MRALILKDFYVVGKQARAFFLLLLVFTCLPGSFYNTFAIFYATMLPYTVMAYDERSKWDHLAPLLPYSPGEIVGSKYVLGYLSCLAAAALSLILRLALGSFLHQMPAQLVASTAAALGTGFCILAITLPLMFRFGVERGRLVMFFMIVLVCASAGVLGTIFFSAGELPPSSSLALPSALLLLGGLAVSILSIPLSIGIYRRRLARGN